MKHFLFLAVDHMMTIVHVYAIDEETARKNVYDNWWSINKDKWSVTELKETPNLCHTLYRHNVTVQ